MEPDPHPPREPVGLIGLGLMGSALAERLRAGGFPVLGFDLRPERLAEARALGITTAANAAQVFASCRRVLLSLFDSADVRSLLETLPDQRPAGQLLIDTTTGDAASASEAGRRLAARGIGYLDATISGNREQLRRGEVTFMVGGPTAAYAACQDLWTRLGAHHFHLGEWGTGAAMKLVSNLVLGLNRAALAEGLALASALGLDPATALAVLKASPAYSRMMDVKGDAMLRHDFTPVARLAQHHKDVRLILEAGGAAGLPMPLSRAHQQVLAAAEAAGLGDLDNSAILQIMEGRAAQPPSPPPGA
jgi:3-hydroxyisobutyrate dehydrogenase-like beta-hydroxyacid dehydrogenase